jgi:hypothetical protein
MFVCGRPFQLGLIFEGKARSPPKRFAAERCSIKLISNILKLKINNLIKNAFGKFGKFYVTNIWQY